MLSAPTKSLKPLTNKQKRAVNRAAITEKVKEFLQSVGINSGEGEAVRQLLRERAKSDFWFFQHHVVGNKDTLNPLHLDLCEKFQRRYRKSFTLWLLPRFHLKTSIITVAGTLWIMINNPHTRNLIANATLSVAIDILADIRNVVETGEVFRWLFPEYCVDLAPKTLRNRCKWLTDRLDFPCSKYAGRKEGNVECMGAEASRVSKHYDYLWLDDTINDVNTATKEYRDKMDKWRRNVLQLRHDLASPIHQVGTRWHFDDGYARQIKTEKERRKAAKDAGKSVKPYLWIYHRQVVEEVEDGSGETIAGYDNVRPIWPERFDGAAIDRLREDNGSYIFSCQFMNNPVPEEDAIFKITDINEADEYDIPEGRVNFISCDVAVEESVAGDWWVITCAGFDSDGNMYVREIVRDKLLTSSFLQHVVRMTKKWNAVKVSVETTAFQNTLYKVYKRLTSQTGFNIPWVEIKRGTKTKRARILGLQPRVERGDFYYEKGIRNADWMIEEMTTYPRSAHDDILDTLADLEALYYNAPESLIEHKVYDTYDAMYGNIEEEVEEDSTIFSSDFLMEIG